MGPEDLSMLPWYAALCILVGAVLLALSILGEDEEEP